MAIVFISPKEKQKVFIIGIIGLFFLVLVLIGLLVFSAKPKKAAEQVFNAPKIEINFGILDSNVIKNLYPLPEMKKEFSYTGQTSKKIPKSGTIIASSQEEAMQALITLGLADIVLKEITGGRDNPFTPYYKIEPST